MNELTGSADQEPWRRGGAYGASPTGNVFMVLAHMDDFKATGPQAYLNWLRDVLSKAFGGDVNMEQPYPFIHTGINHTRIQEKDSSKFHYVLDLEYASAIKPVPIPEQPLIKIVGIIKQNILSLFHKICQLFKNQN